MQTHNGVMRESTIVFLPPRGRLRPFTDVKGCERNPVTARQSATGEEACRLYRQSSEAQIGREQGALRCGKARRVLQRADTFLDICDSYRSS